MSIPRQLVEYINSGRCFALIGSGLSSGMGYPTWEELATAATTLIPPTDAEHRALNTLLDRKNYPEVFERVAARAGDGPLLTHLRAALQPRHTQSDAYNLLAKWPFSSYLTTNYDDEINKHLSARNEHFTTLGNSQQALSEIQAASQRRIVKLHGALTEWEGLVLTTAQYNDFYAMGRRQYYRAKITSIFQMVPVIVVGYSLSDKDMDLILLLAKESNSLDKPIYMLLAEADATDVERLAREYNIRVISYPNADRRHSALLQLLRQIDHFIIPRRPGRPPVLEYPEPTEVQAAVSLYVHYSLKFGQDASLLERALKPQLLVIIASAGGKLAMNGILPELMPKSLKAVQGISSHVQRALQHLEDSDLITRGQGLIQLTQRGVDASQEMSRRQLSQADQVYGALRARLANYGSETDVDTLTEGFRNALTAVFRKRGLAAASVLFGSQAFDAADMPDLFDAVFPPAANVSDFTLRAEYCSAVMDILTKPNEEQKQYLAGLAQGFFAYHMFGIDPEGQRLRTQMVQGVAWVIDSNVLIPLIAKGCQQHGFMDGLIRRMKGLGISMATTPMIIAEVDRVYKWARSQVSGVSSAAERNRVLSLVSAPGESVNPFIDAYVHGQSSGLWHDFAEFGRIIGDEGKGLGAAIEKCGIQVINPSSLCTADDAEQIGVDMKAIYIQRERAGTLRGDGNQQATAEAEVMYVVRRFRTGRLKQVGDFNNAYCLSTSRILDSTFRTTDGLISWHPDTLHKHVQFLSGDVAEADEVFAALTTSYYAAGVSVLDDESYQRYFRPTITEATATLEREVDAYARAVTDSVEAEHSQREMLLDRFQKTPDLEKPRFVAQLGWMAARRAEQRAKIAESAREESEKRRKKEVADLRQEYDRKLKETQRHEEGRKRNMQDPKHQAKRERQAKRRKRK